MNAHVILPALTTMAALILLLIAAAVQRAHEIRQARREAAAARHPSRRALPRRTRPHVPGLPVDGEPLSEKDLNAFIGIMTRSTTRPQDQAPKTSTNEGAE
jgi:hypothetical protein